MAKEIKYYEMSYLVSPELAEEQVLAIEEKLRASLGRFDAEIDSWQSPKKRGLGYPVADQTEAYLGVLRFNGKPKHAPEIKNMLRDEPHIIRSMVLEWKKQPIRARMIPKQATPKEEQVPTDEKALDEKLEEIFGKEV